MRTRPEQNSDNGYAGSSEARAASPIAPAWLTDKRGQEHPIHGACLLGRHAECDVLLEGTSVSRRHALVHSPDEHRFWITDLNSINGVFANRHRVQRHLLADGDEIRIGEHQLRFHQRTADSQSQTTGQNSVKTAREESVPTAQTYGVMVIGKGDEILNTTREMERLMGRCFPGRQPGRVPEEFMRALAKLRQDSGSAPQPVIVTCGGRQLGTRLLSDSTDASVLLVYEEGPVGAELIAERTGLTLREAEVVRWILEGKSNREVAMLLGISVRTAENHLAKIFPKLGVESRTALVRTMLDALGRW